MTKIKNDVNKEKNESFFYKMKNDKKYNAKIQLIGYGVFIGILVVWLNLSSIFNANTDGSSIDNLVIDNDGEIEHVDDTDLLGSLSDNYSYDIVIDVTKKSMNIDTSEEVEVAISMLYAGKSYDNKLEIQKTVTEVTDMYYKLDNNYYNQVDNIISLVKDVQVYDVIDSKYIELNSILMLMDKASLDYVTNYSSGRKELVYKLKVKDVILSHQGNDEIIINVIEENGVLTINIDYSKLYSVIDNSITECKMTATISDIGKIEDFEVVVNDNDLDEDE